MEITRIKEKKSLHTFKDSTGNAYFGGLKNICNIGSLSFCLYAVPIMVFALSISSGKSNTSLK